MSGSPDGVYEAGVVDPGIPVGNATKPFWLTQPSPIDNSQSPWRKDADVVIIGSGVTGTSIARDLLTRRPELRVVMLEARDVCSGATGRNGGHIKVMSYNVWLDRKKKFGLIEAIKWTQFEHGHLSALTAAIKEAGVECDLKLQEGIDAYYDDSTFQSALHALEDMGRFVPAVAKDYTIYDATEAQTKLGCAETCVGAIGVPAAALWPYKMVTGFLQRLVADHGLSIQTQTKVLSIEDSDQASGATVRTNRGVVHAKHVIHATNAWLGHLVPELRPYISPVRGNVARLALANGDKQLKNTFWLRYGEKDYDYLIPREDDSVIIGRANLGRRAVGDDSVTDTLPQAHLASAIPHVLQLEPLEVTHTWSGILGFTQDQNPFVGRLPFPQRSHQWVCGGYHGIGMVKAFLTGKILAAMVLGEKIPEPFPRSMLCDQTRMSSLRASLKTSKM